MKIKNLVSKKGNILVTGATGFVGANLVRRLLKKGYQVHIITRKTSNKWRLSDILPSINDHTVDLREFKKLERVVEEIKPETIFHLATAGVYGGKSLPEREVININFLGTLNLIEACEKVDYRCFVLTGSSAEYGPKNKPMKETDMCEPLSMYGITKVASTLYGQLVAQLKQRPIITLRLFSPFGPYDDNSRLVTYAIFSALKGEDLALANPDAVRDYIYVEEVVNAYLKAMIKGNKLKGEVFNVGSGKEMKISYVVKKILEFTSSKSKVFWNKTAKRVFDSPCWEANLEKSKKLLGFDLGINFDEGLKMTVDWFKNNLKLYEK